MKENDEKYRNVSTKVKPEYYGYYTLWCDQHDTTIYDQTQLLVEGFLAYTSSTYNLSEEMQQMRYAFETQPGWKDIFNLCDYKPSPKIEEAIYFVGADNKKGVRPVLVSMPFMGSWTQSMNVQQVVERTMENCCNTLYHELRDFGRNNNTNSVLETIQKLLIINKQHMNQDQLDEMFADNDRSEFGVKPNTDGPYKRKLKRTAEIEKEKKDKAEGDEMQQELDWKPFTSEW